MTEQANPVRGLAPPLSIAPFFARVVATGPGGAWLVATGELDAASGPALEACLIAAAPRLPAVFVDLADVSFIDCSGLLALLASARGLARQNRRLVVCNPSATVRRLFRLTNAENTLDVEDGVSWARMRRGA